MNLPNVKLFHPSVATSKLFKKCSIVATITGTAGLESAFYGKPSLVFTDTIYSHLPHVSRIKNIEELPYAIEESLNKKINSESVKQLLNYFQEISFDVNIVDLQNELNNNRPIIYVGYSNDGGHAWNIDGYDDDYFHNNWGWGGSQNGYFLLSSVFYEFLIIVRRVKNSKAKISRSQITKKNVAFKLKRTRLCKFLI